MADANFSHCVVVGVTKALRLCVRASDFSHNVMSDNLCWASVEHKTSNWAQKYRNGTLALKEHKLFSDFSPIDDATNNMTTWKQTGLTGTTGA